MSDRIAVFRVKKRNASATAEFGIAPVLDGQGEPVGAGGGQIVEIVVGEGVGELGQPRVVSDEQDVCGAVGLGM